MHVYTLPQQSGLVWNVATGTLYLEDDQGCRVALARGYAGAPGSINNPEHEGRRSAGPIPRGRWLLDAPANRPTTGPVSIGLEAQDPKTAQGRSAFYIHGDNAAGDGTASRGCIILDRRARQIISELYWAGWRTLDVE